MNEAIYSLSIKVYVRYLNSHGCSLFSKTLALRLFYFRFLSFKGHSKSDACLGLKQETCMKLLNTLEKIQTNATNVTMHPLMQVL